MKTSAAAFFHAWLGAVEEMRPELTAKWRNNRDFTAAVKSSGDCVLNRVAARIGLKCYPYDYYCVDAVFYEPSDKVPDAPQNSTWLSGVSVAFEHENDVRSGLYKEASHLLITNADLRVLVTYPYWDNIADEEFKSVKSLVGASRHAKQISDDESFLLILGYEEPFKWEGFAYKTSDWLPLAVC